MAGKLFIRTFGCQMNEYDSEKISAVLADAEGLEPAASAAEAADLYRQVGIPVVEGLAEFRRGAYGKAVELLLQVRFDLWQIGGSHAQRDIFEQLTIDSLIRSNNSEQARALLGERLAARTRNRFAEERLRSLMRPRGGAPSSNRAAAAPAY